MNLYNFTRGMLTVLISLYTAASVHAHCEIPCGIYDDSMRVALIIEDIKTIEKSMSEIITLSTQSPVNFNQLVRWINNKEAHAEKIQNIVFQYFMNQRIKPVAAEGEKMIREKYILELTALHELLVYAMYCKQSTDTAHVVKLRESLTIFTKSYFGGKKQMMKK